MKNLHKRRITLVTGGAASGKSELAEEICCKAGGRMLYIATMRPFGDDAQFRIERHRALRRGKGFDTLECYHGLDKLALPQPCDTVLLEDVGNLVANHLFGGEDTADAAQRITDGIFRVSEQAGALIVVANEVFSASQRFEGEMEAYLETMAQVHREVARQAVCVVESVCGLPQILRGELAI